MYSRENFDDTIAEHVSKLNYAWFEKKRVEFRKTNGFKSDLGKIVLVEKNVSWNNEYDEVGDIISSEPIDVSETHTFDLVTYCASYLPLDENTYWGSFPFEDFSSKYIPSNNINEFSADLINDISKFAKDINDLSALENFIHRTLELIWHQLGELGKLHSDHSEYITVLKMFHERCVAKLYRRFQRQLTVFEVSNEYLDALKFNVSQRTLASLLFVLKEAGCFYLEPNEKDRIDEIIRFAQKYFHFPLAGEHKPSNSPKQLKNVFNNVSNFDTPKSEHYQYGPLKELIQQLQYTLADLKKRGKF
jgi:hypothetical protein